MSGLSYFCWNWAPLGRICWGCCIVGCSCDFNCWCCSCCWLICWFWPICCCWPLRLMTLFPCWLLLISWTVVPGIGWPICLIIVGFCCCCLGTIIACLATPCCWIGWPKLFTIICCCWDCMLPWPGCCMPCCCICCCCSLRPFFNLKKSIIWI